MVKFTDKKTESKCPSKEDHSVDFCLSCWALKKSEDNK